jgi:hypothetical protein
MNKNNVWEYKYMSYNDYPRANELNEEGLLGWEVIQINKFLVDKGNSELTIQNPEYEVLVLFKRLIREF